MSGEKIAAQSLPVPRLDLIENADGGYDVVAGRRVIATLALTNVERFAGVIYYDLDIRARSYTDQIEDQPKLKTWTRLHRSGSDTVTHYTFTPKGSET